MLQWVPTAIAGIINVRFPSGRPSSTLGQWLDRALGYGIAVAVVANYLGDSVARDAEALVGPLTARRPIDGTWVTQAGNASIVLVPILILLSALAGVGVIVQCFKVLGMRREQTQWRAAGAAVALVLFPLALVDALPAAASVAWPVIFVTTLLIPVLRYQL